ncbi:hypothetical protein [Pasteuria penetrans]|nr:hypothetical protein [Pasteuria penetrans]
MQVGWFRLAVGKTGVTRPMAHRLKEAPAAAGAGTYAEPGGNWGKNN